MQEEKEQQFSKCYKCSKILKGFWNMESNPKNLIYNNNPSGRFFGITDGHFLKSHDDWVNVFCYNCFIIQIKSLSFLNCTRDQLSQENTKLRIIISNLNNEKSMVYNDFKSISNEKRELNEVMSILSNEKETLGMDFEKFSNENEELKSKIIELNKEIENLKSEILLKDMEIEQKENYNFRKVFDFCGFDKLKEEMEILTLDERKENIKIDIEEDIIFKEFEEYLNTFAKNKFKETKNLLLDNIEKELEFSKENIDKVKLEIEKYEISMSECRIPIKVSKESLTPLENYSKSLGSYIERLNKLNQNVTKRKSFKNFDTEKSLNTSNDNFNEENISQNNISKVNNDNEEDNYSRTNTENFDGNKTNKSNKINNMSNYSINREEREEKMESENDRKSKMSKISSNNINEENKSKNKIFLTENSNNILDSKEK